VSKMILPSIATSLTALQYCVGCKEIVEEPFTGGHIINEKTYSLSQLKISDGVKRTVMEASNCPPALVKFGGPNVIIRNIICNKHNFQERDAAPKIIEDTLRVRAMIKRVKGDDSPYQ